MKVIMVCDDNQADGLPETGHLSVVSFNPDRLEEHNGIKVYPINVDAECDCYTIHISGQYITLKKGEFCLLLVRHCTGASFTRLRRLAGITFGSNHSTVNIARYSGYQKTCALKFSDGNFCLEPLEDLWTSDDLPFAVAGIRDDPAHSLVCNLNNGTASLSDIEEQLRKRMLAGGHRAVAREVTSGDGAPPEVLQDGSAQGGFAESINGTPECERVLFMLSLKDWAKLRRPMRHWLSDDGRAGLVPSDTSISVTDGFSYHESRMSLDKKQLSETLIVIHGLDINTSVDHLRKEGLLWGVADWGSALPEHDLFFARLNSSLEHEWGELIVKWGKHIWSCASVEPIRWVKHRGIGLLTCLDLDLQDAADREDEGTALMEIFARQQEWCKNNSMPIVQLQRLWCLLAGEHLLPSSALPPEPRPKLPRAAKGSSLYECLKDMFVKEHNDAWGTLLRHVGLQWRPNAFSVLPEDEEPISFFRELHEPISSLAELRKLAVRHQKWLLKLGRIFEEMKLKAAGDTCDTDSSS